MDAIIHAITPATWAIVITTICLVVMRLLGDKGRKAQSILEVAVDSAYYAAESAKRKGLLPPGADKVSVALAKFREVLEGQGIAPTLAMEEIAKNVWASRAEAEHVQAGVGTNSMLGVAKLAAEDIKSETAA